MDAQKFKEITPRDVIWNIENLIPEPPKQDGSAENHLRKIRKTPKDYVCTTLVATTINAGNQCSVCQQEQTKTKLCRLIQRDEVCDVSICTECINAFIEYNPNSVYDLELTETK